MLRHEYVMFDTLLPLPTSVNLESSSMWHGSKSIISLF